MQKDLSTTRREFIKSIGVIGGAVALSGLGTGVWAAPESTEAKVSGAYGDACMDRSLLDTKFDGMLVNLDKWFANHSPAPGTLVRSDVMFESPRCQIAAVSNKGQNRELYYCSDSDEVVYVFRGEAEQYVNGEWKNVQAGHMCVIPRGVVQGTRIPNGKEFLVLSFRAARPAGKSDKVALKDVAPGTVVGDKGLIDTTCDGSMLINLASFFDTHPLEPGKQLRLDPVCQSPRSLVLLITNPILPPHYHTSAEEVVIAHKGSGTMYINGKWTEVKEGDVHINPRGMIHGTKALGPEGMQVATLFAPPPVNGNDRVYVEFAK